MDVSVVIPTYDRPKFLKDTIESVLRQSVDPREIIVVDNGTKDDTRAMVEANFAGKVIYVREPRHGVQTARNTGIARAQGEWIATLDDDDLRDSDFLRLFQPAVNDGRANLIFSDHRKFVDGKTRKAFAQTNFEMAPDGYWDGVPRPATGKHWSFVGKFPPERILRFNAFYPSTMLARRDLVEAIGGYNPEVCGIKAEDIEFLLRALHHGKLAVIWLPLVGYRIHGSNASGGDWVSQMIGRWQIFEYVLAHGAYGCERLRAALEADLPDRRAMIFDQAWRHSRFDVTDEVNGLLRPEDRTFLRRLRIVVRHAPPPIRAAVMHLREAAGSVRSARVSAATTSEPRPSLVFSDERPAVCSVASMSH